MKKVSELGKLEFEVLRFFVTHGPATVGEAAAEFGEKFDYARTTIQTVMERLRQKGFLDRKMNEGTFSYFSTIPSTAFFAGMVRDFVRDNLGSDMTPLVAYLSGSKGLTEEEEQVLRRLAAKVDHDEGSDA